MDVKLTREDVQRRLTRSHFNSWLELQVIAVDPDIIFRFSPKDLMRGRPGDNILHGGIIAALIDVGAAFAVMTRSGGAVATASMTVDFHRPAIYGDLVLTGHVVKYGRNICSAHARLETPEGVLVADGRCMLTHVKDTDAAAQST